jgi:UV excision repair protein RAD23
MAEQAETAFARTFLNTLSTQPITFADDYQQALELTLKKVPVLPISVPPPPERKEAEASSSSSALISLTFKSLKPPASFTLGVHPTDTISAIKSQLAAQPSAPPADAQRLLLKGKALADGKLLKEYNIKGGDTVNLMVKPGHHWDPTAAVPSSTTTEPSPSSTSLAAMPTSDSSSSNPFGSGSLDPSTRPKAGGGHGRHQRIPSVVLSPSPSTDTPGLVEKDIMLTIDAGILPSPVAQNETQSTYHQTVAKPEFWEGLYTFLSKEFTTDADVHLAFEDFLCATKGSLTASEIAKIRDTVGVVGMAGT